MTFVPMIERLHASVFDLHLWKSPLIEGHALNSGLAHFADPAASATPRTNAAGVSLPNLWVFSLAHRHDRHRFWGRYAELADSAPADVKHWLLPLRCRPKTLCLKFVGGIPQPVATFATIWLWPFGWVSNLEFSVRTPLGLSRIQKVSQALRGKVAEPPFLLDGAVAKLPQVFNHLSQLVQQDVPAGGKGPGADLIVSKRMVLTLVPTKDSPPRRYGASPAHVSQWSDADRARLHAALLADDVGIDEILRRERESAFMLTAPLDDGVSFALTYFDEGTLLSLGPLGELGKWRETGRCFARNVSNVSLAAMALECFIHREDRRSTGKPAVAQLVGAARRLLDDIATQYKNRFAQKFLELNASIKRARG